MRDPKKDVTFVFYCYEHESAQLKIRLRHDGLTQSEFFRTLLKMYITKDPTMTQVVDKIKERQNTMGKQKRRKSTAMIARGRTIMEDLGITPTDKEAIFDIIELGGLEHEED